MKTTIMTSLAIALAWMASTGGTLINDVEFDQTVEHVGKQAGFVQSNELNVVMTRHDDGSIYTNFMGKVVQDMGRAMDLSPINLTPQQ